MIFNLFSLLIFSQDVLWQIYFFYAHHASSVRKVIGRRAHSPAPSHSNQNQVKARTDTAKYDEKLLHHTDFLQLLGDFGLMSRIKWVLSIYLLQCVVCYFSSCTSLFSVKLRIYLFINTLIFLSFHYFAFFFITFFIHFLVHSVTCSLLPYM